MSLREVYFPQPNSTLRYHKHSHKPLLIVIFSCVGSTKVIHISSEDDDHVDVEDAPFQSPPSEGNDDNRQARTDLSLLVELIDKEDEGDDAKL